MKFKIHNNNIDNVIVEGDTVKECRKKCNDEMVKRGWIPEDCWSEQVDNK